MGGETVKGYIISVICVSIVGSIASMLSLEGENGGLGKHFRLIFGICIVLVCLNPIKDIFNYIENAKNEWIVEGIVQNEEKYSEMFDKSFAAAEITNLKNGIKQLLNDRFDIDPAECEIAVSLNDSGDIKRIFITLYGRAVWKDTAEIENYLFNIFKCEIVTAVG